MADREHLAGDLDLVQHPFDVVVAGQMLGVEDGTDRGPEEEILGHGRIGVVAFPVEELH